MKDEVGEGGEWNGEGLRENERGDGLGISERK